MYAPRPGGIEWRQDDHGRPYLHDGRSAEALEAERLRQRAEMLEPNSLQAFAAARVWLRQWSKTKGFCRHGSSYNVKHIAEPQVGYSTNGVFVAAALAEGFQIKAGKAWPTGLNVRFNISARAWARLGTR
jgi:hypothetical protein